MKKRLAELKKKISLTARGYRILWETGMGRDVLLSGLASAVGAVAPLITFYFSGQIINELAGDRDPQRLIWLASLTVGLGLCLHLLKNLLGRGAEARSGMFFIRMYMLYSQKLLDMDYEDVEDARVQAKLDKIKQLQNWNGQGLMRLYWVAGSLSKGVVGTLSSLALTLGLFLAPVRGGEGVAAVLASHWGTALILGLSALSVVVTQRCSDKDSRLWGENVDYMTLINRLFMYLHFDLPDDHKQGKEIRLYREAPLVKSAIDEYLQTWKEDMNGKAGRFARIWGMRGVCPFLISGAVYLVVAAKAFCGAIGLGGVVQYAGAVGCFASSFQILVDVLTRLASNAQFLEVTYDFLDLENKKYQGALPTEKRLDNEYLIEFRDVSFKYPGSDSWALRHLNLTLKIGERLAVVGRNGSGKTTMIKLLCRLYDPTEGVITLNGIDIKKYNYDEYLALFSVVFQDFHLFSFPLGQAVAASVKYDKKGVEKALDQAGLEERLRVMPQGLETYLNKDFDDSGVEFSGGEAQKAAIARALYKDAPFLVLDEPTAALDPLAEYEVYRRFGEMAGEKTAVCISHRLSSCRFCDRIAVFEKGRLVQVGTHDSLTAKAGAYQRLWDAQARYYDEQGIVFA